MRTGKPKTNIILDCSITIIHTAITFVLTVAVTLRVAVVLFYLLQVPLLRSVLLLLLLLATLSSLPLLS